MRCVLFVIGICIPVDTSTETVDAFSEPVDDFTEPVDDSTEPVDDSTEPVDDSTETVDASTETVDDSTEIVDGSTETVDVVSGTATEYTFNSVRCGCLYECDADTVRLDCLTSGAVRTSNEAAHRTLCITTGP